MKPIRIRLSDKSPLKKSVGRFLIIKCKDENKAASLCDEICFRTEGVFGGKSVIGVESAHVYGVYPPVRNSVYQPVRRLPSNAITEYNKSPGNYEVFLINYRDKIECIKAIRGIMNLGLYDSKVFSESLPKVLVSGITREEAERIKGVFQSIDCLVRVDDMGPAEDRVKVNSGNYSVSLVSYGEHKISCIKEVRGLTGLGLKESKDFVESPLPRVLVSNVSYDEADRIKKIFESAGSITVRESLC